MLGDVDRFYGIVNVDEILQRFDEKFGDRGSVTALFSVNPIKAMRIRSLALQTLFLRREARHSSKLLVWQKVFSFVLSELGIASALFEELEINFKDLESDRSKVLGDEKFKKYASGLCRYASVVEEIERSASKIVCGGDVHGDSSFVDKFTIGDSESDNQSFEKNWSMIKR